MGRNNKANRAAKAKARLRTRARAGGAAGHTRAGHAGADRAADPMFTSAEVATYLWTLAARAAHHGVPDSEELRRLIAMPSTIVDRAFETIAGQHINLLYANGWLPGEVLRQGRLPGRSVSWGRLLARALAYDDAGRRASTLDSAWITHVAALELPAEDGSAGWVHRWRHAEQLQHDASLEIMLAGYVSLLDLPPMHPLLPTPGAPGGRPHAPSVSARRGAATNPILAKVRNLLAKAESSTFEAEASAFTAKAQELITRHAIDTALLEEGAPSDQTPLETRLPIDPPYADAKSFLLQTVAETGRCRAVFMPRVQMSTLIGYPSDVEAVEALFTSLLVQAQHALNEAAKSARAGARTRSRSYRSAFLSAYTQRIGERLRLATAQTVDKMSQETGRDLLPVLADRTHDVEGYVSNRFGNLVASPVHGGADPAGWAGGRMAADRAQLAFGELDDLGTG